VIEEQSVIAIIPARGGSKGVLRKNIRDFRGQPLIVWTIQAALQSKYIDTVIVTSDDNEILQVAHLNRAKVLKRPSYLATDQAKSVDVVAHVLENVEPPNYDIVMLLQPTSPLRNSCHIDESLELYTNKGSGSVVSVNKVRESPHLIYSLRDGCISPLINESQFVRRQDFLDYYILNGAIYIVNRNKFEISRKFIFKDTCAYIMSTKDSLDIDEESDFNF